MKNDYLEYYGKHHISPVKQDINDLERHYERRRKLYRQCGIPVMAFRNAEILEVGPGGGYNTLAFFHWGSKHVDLVEANPKGIEDMRELFTENAIDENKYEIFPCMIEKFETDKKYDIVVAEGFLPNLYNQKEVIDRLRSLTAENGVVVITCSEDVGFFIEIMKRLIGGGMTAHIEEYDRKVECLAGLFTPQLARLKGVSRSPEEWVQDQILNPAAVNGTELTLLQAMVYFGDEFDVLGSSPRMFTDYSWYKDIEYDYKKDYQRQFERKRLSLLMAGMPEISLPVEQADTVVRHMKNIKRLESEYEKNFDRIKIGHILEEMEAIEKALKGNFDTDFLKVFSEIKEILSVLLKEGKVEMENYPHFFEAFGRTQQYISFVRK